MSAAMELYFEKYDDLKKELEYRYKEKYFTVDDLLQEIYISLRNVTSSTATFNFLLVVARNVYYNMTAKICGYANNVLTNKKQKIKKGPLYCSNRFLEALHTTSETPETLLIEQEALINGPLLINNLKLYSRNKNGKPENAFLKQILLMILSGRDCKELVKEFGLSFKSILSSLFIGIRYIYEQT